MELHASLSNLRFVRRAIILLFVSLTHAALEEKVCLGTNEGFVEPTKHEAHFQEIKDRYTGCTFVQGNLELTWLRSSDLDLSFLSTIREVSGYVLLFNVGVRRVPLTSLQIIRGEKLMKTTAQREGFALLATTVTTEYLEMPALREIQKGCVGFLQSYNLCHIEKIDWKYINQDCASNVFDIKETETECSPCDTSCDGRCWGPGTQNCQKTGFLKCHSECSGRCFGVGYTDCCHSYCAVGCNDTQPYNCIACKHYSDEGTCVVSCPKGKFKYGASCVTKCPKPMLKDNDACVPVCPPGKRPTDGACIPCEGHCNKVCEGVDIIHSGNVVDFQNCTTIHGSLGIKDVSFSGFQQFHSNFVPGPLYKEMHPDALEVLSTVREITGYLRIMAKHPSFKDLSFFRSLEVIGGSVLPEDQAALFIEKTSLTTLGLRSLRRVSNGNVIIRDNEDLCLLKQKDWNEIKSSPTHSVQIQGNRPESDCINHGYLCHSQCSSEGCWGTGADECFSCVNYKLKELCIAPCMNSSRAELNNLDKDEICFTKEIIPGLSLYVVNENTKELEDGQTWNSSFTSAYVTTHKQYQIWMQRLSGNAKPEEVDVNKDTIGSDEAHSASNCSGLKAEWITPPSGLISTRGLVSTNDSDCNHYVGRTTYMGDLIPGKFFIRTGDLYVSWGGKEISTKEFQLLRGGNFEWIPATGKKIPACAVKGGQTVDGTSLYIGRLIRPGDCSELGKINPLDGLLYIGYFSKEQSFSNYDILVFKTA